LKKLAGIAICLAICDQCQEDKEPGSPSRAFHDQPIMRPHRRALVLVQQRDKSRKVISVG
jgi:hypothetical protein